MFSRAALPISMLWFGFAACHHSEQPSVAVAPPRAPFPIGPRCPELLAPLPSSSAAPRIFVDVARLDRSLHRQLVGHLLLHDEEAGMLACDAPSGADSEGRRWDLKVIAHLHSADRSPLRLEVDLTPAPPLGTAQESWSVPEHRRAHTTVVLAEQQSIVLGLPTATGREPLTLQVTPYFIREEGDLRRLFECFMRGARSNVASQ
jgi:hypothetical protein